MVAKCSVLVVDDEENYLDTLVEQLRARGGEVASAPSGEEAQVLLRQAQFDVVILDVNLPGIGGIEILQQIKRQHPATQVVMLSGLADVELGVRSMEIGAFDYLVKPVGVDELVFRIEDAHQTKCLHDDKRRSG